METFLDEDAFGTCNPTIVSLSRNTASVRASDDGIFTPDERIKLYLAAKRRLERLSGNFPPQLITIQTYVVMVSFVLFSTYMLLRTNDICLYLVPVATRFGVLPIGVDDSRLCRPAGPTHWLAPALRWR
jgi:hypothetical protein